jgi:hypothetical protein
LQFIPAASSRSRSSNSTPAEAAAAAAAAAEAPPQQQAPQQVQLTAKQVEQYIAAFKELTPLFEKLDAAAASRIPSCSPPSRRRVQEIRLPGPRRIRPGRGQHRRCA